MITAMQERLESGIDANHQDVGSHLKSDSETSTRFWSGMLWTFRVEPLLQHSNLAVLANVRL